MKIVYLHQYFNNLKDSGSTRSYEMARRLVARGHEVHIITSDRESTITSSEWRETIENGIHVHWLTVPYSNAMSFNRRLLAFLIFAWKSAQKATSIKGDVIFATSTPLTIALPAVYAANRQKIPMVFEVRDLWPEIPIVIGALKGKIQIFLARQLEKFAYRYSKQIIALSPGMKEGVIRSGYPSDRIWVIPNSSDVELFNIDKSIGHNFREQFVWMQDRPLVVYTGTLGIINGVSYFVYLAKAVQEIAPEIRFLVVGDGREKDKVRTLAQELNILDKNFFMFEPLPKVEMPKVLSAADLSVSLVIDLEELWANSANKFFDALASSTPMAINHQGWQADLLRETGTGIVLPPNDIPRAATSLVSFLADKEELRKAGERAFELACTRFHRDQLAMQLEEVLLTAVRETKHRTVETQTSYSQLVKNLKK